MSKLVKVRYFIVPTMLLKVQVSTYSLSRGKRASLAIISVPTGEQLFIHALWRRSFTYFCWDKMKPLEI